MRINDDLAKPVIVHASKLDWVPSPAPGVDRRMLFRVGGEVARATSIVRYAPGSAFARHTHSGGEEFLVLDGVFQDEHGDYPPGSYIRNPPGTSHVPASKDGCTIFVRLWQFRADDRAPVMHRPDESDAPSTLLFDDGREKVSLSRWGAEQSVVRQNASGLEFLVVSGDLTMNGEKLEAQAWGRLPAGMALNATAGPHGATLWIKEAPLLHPDVCQLPE
jgi:anti-sigma factor ChrR (cupin superfamily)